ncbi:MAG: hypothetical protein KGL53_17140 [Elusimicrobia bacterium]|nr:hypothetical protein [Elusimicrobiota bacterium]
MTLPDRLLYREVYLGKVVREGVSYRKYAKVPRLRGRLRRAVLALLALAGLAAAAAALRRP